MGKTPYQEFLQKVRPKVQQENPGLSYTELSIKLATMWKDLKPEEKKIYEDLAASKKEQEKREIMLCSSTQADPISSSSSRRQSTEISPIQITHTEIQKPQSPVLSPQVPIEPEVANIEPEKKITPKILIKKSDQPIEIPNKNYIDQQTETYYLTSNVTTQFVPELSSVSTQTDELPQFSQHKKKKNKKNSQQMNYNFPPCYFLPILMPINMPQMMIQPDNLQQFLQQTFKNQNQTNSDSSDNE